MTTAMAMTGASPLASIGAAWLVLWALAMWTAVGVLGYANRRAVRDTIKPWAFATAAGVIGLGVIGQLGHVQEHLAQVTYWLAHPNEQAWMTPLGTGLAAGLGQFTSDMPSLGMEILHLLGNSIFLAGLVGVLLVTRRAFGSRARRWAKLGALVQGSHGVEHLVLTLSVALGASQAVGLSTWFGLLDPGPGLWTYRIWWHFLANVVGSVIFALALYHLWRERREVAAACGSQVPEQRAAGAAEAARALPAGSGGC